MMYITVLLRHYDVMMYVCVWGGGVVLLLQTEEEEEEPSLPRSSLLLHRPFGPIGIVPCRNRGLKTFGFGSDF